MSQFEFLLALYAIVAGLGLSLLVRSIGQMIEARDRVRLYWVHTCWIAIAFVGHVVSWFVLWSYVQHEPWTVLQALLLLCVPILLYLVSHLAVPELADGATHDMRAYYYRHARWIQGLTLGAVLAAALIHVVVEGRLDVSGAHATRLAMVAIVIPGIYTLDPRVHSVQAALLLLLMAFAVSFVTKPLT